MQTGKINVQRAIEIIVEGIRVRFEPETNNGFRKVTIFDANGRTLGQDWVAKSAKPNKKNAVYLVKKHAHEQGVLIDVEIKVYVNLELWQEPQAS